MREVKKWNSKAKVEKVRKYKKTNGFKRTQCVSISDLQEGGLHIRAKESGGPVEQTPHRLSKFKRVIPKIIAALVIENKKTARVVNYVWRRINVLISNTSTETPFFPLWWSATYHHHERGLILN